MFYSILIDTSKDDGRWADYVKCSSETLFSIAFKNLFGKKKTATISVIMVSKMFVKTH